MKFSRRYKDAEERKKVIEKVDTILNGDPFPFYKEKFYTPNSNAASDETMRKLLTDFKLFNQVLENFKSFCPSLEPSLIAKGEHSEEKRELVKQAMKTIKWDELNADIYDLLETEGDCFFYIYFDESDKDNKYRIPRLSLLESKNMENIVTDDSNQVVAYVYKEQIKRDEIDYSTGEITTNDMGEATYIFKKGEVIRYKEGKKEKGLMSVTPKGVLKISTLENSKSYMDMIPIIHIAGNKRQDEKFSIIPSQDYVEVVLQLMQIESDIRATNRQLGFPRITLLDCKYVEGDGKIGGVRIAQTSPSPNLDEAMIDNIKGQVIQHQSATNESFFTERKNVIDSLYNLVGVTNPSMMQRVGSSDSSKVIQQVNARMERKVERYIKNIMAGFMSYFKILFLENNLYDASTDETYTFAKPRSIVRNSAYDDLLIDTMGLNSGIYSLRDILERQGKTEQEIQSHFKHLNEEHVGEKDITIGDVETESEDKNSVQSPKEPTPIEKKKTSKKKKVKTNSVLEE